MPRVFSSGPANLLLVRLRDLQPNTGGGTLQEPTVGRSLDAVEGHIDPAFFIVIVRRLARPG